MKKLLRYTMLAVGCLALTTACNNDDVTNDIAQHNVKVLSAQTAFNAVGGTDSITIEGNVAHAYANAPWATITTKGNLVEVTTQPNETVESRHTTVVIKTSPQDSTVVNIDQLGCVVKFNFPEHVGLNDDAKQLSYPIESTFGAQTQTKVDWLQSSYVDGKVVVSTQPNNTGHVRQAFVYVKTKTKVDSILVTQGDLDRDIVGNYVMQVREADQDGAETTHFYDVVLAHAGNKLTLKLAALGLEIPVIYDAEACGLRLTGGNKVGTYQQYTLFTSVANNGNKASWEKSAQLTGRFAYREALQRMNPIFEGTMLSFGNTAQLLIEAFESTEIDKDKNLGALAIWESPILIKIKPTTPAKHLPISTQW